MELIPFAEKDLDAFLAMCRDMYNSPAVAHSFSGEIGAPIVMIDELYLIPEARGHHIGRAILEALSAYYRNKAGALKLECTPENQVAMRL